MIISFNINFYTLWGQSLFIIGSIPELGNWKTEEAKEMLYTYDGNWTLELDLPDQAILIEYRYFLKSNNNLVFEEWNKNHRVIITNTLQSYYLLDYWQNRPQNMAFYSSAFIKSWHAHPCDKFERVVKSKRKILLKALAPSVAKNESLALLGNQEEIGNWDRSKILVMGCEKFPEWQVQFNSDQVHYPIEYKFCIINNEDKSIVRWEKGENRNLNVPYLKENETGIVSGLLFRDEKPEWKCAGIAIPVFSLKTENSFGIGDFGDLLRMIDWVKLTDQRLIQVLPVNDTTMNHSWMDSYPYNAISIYALHPLYLNLEAMGVLKEPGRDAFFKAKQKELNDLPSVDYEQVDCFKWAFFHEIFQQEGKELLASSKFADFFEENKEWLIPYAAYSYLRDQRHTPDFRLWKEYAVYNRSSIEQLCSPDSAEYPNIAIYYYLQFHAHQQLTQARNYAYHHGVVLKGDVPIGISRESIEAWTEPSYFNIHFQAGAPPDDFSITGQNWGFPTYNWEVMDNDHYRWWKKRFLKISDYFDAYRIDHILGFFRIWQIPESSVEGLLGYFSPSLPFSVEEIENSGLKFRREIFTRAHIHEKFLPELFGEYVPEVKQVYLDGLNAEHFVLKQEFDTQQKIRNHFLEKTDAKSQCIQTGLFAICNEVLFIEDADKSAYYHPRISASSSYVYQELDASGKYAFEYLYWNYFYQRHNDFWKKEAIKHLTPLINSTDMLVCGEDLGMIPASVQEVMNKLQILSLEIERMPKTPNTEFTNLRTLPYLSVCTTSTHDMHPLRAWWKEDSKKTQGYYNKVLKKEGVAPLDCTPELCEAIIRNHLLAPSMLTIVPFQDWLSMDGRLRHSDIEAERINIPSHPRHYWKYRMHLTINELMKAEELNGKIRQLIAESNRKS
ncbi:MAG: 4-alpha-glucanotransferase [Candidatus Azobacteroides sp.]|nr:4-alpha-glucanotransferase [Candidatus Azobacteroides sp.]